jgi:3-carboxy-cis,cis-muconate cycloisomerase
VFQAEESLAVRLIESLATTEALAEVFSDRSVLAALLEFEVGLARTQAQQSLIPQTAADAITAAAHLDNFDTAALAAEILRAGTPGIPIVKALTEVVRRVDPSAAGYVHWGATSQDVADTAMVLLLKRAQPLLENDLSRLQSALRRLAEDHAATVMLGRTLMQAAPPITFGLKAAHWLQSVGSCSGHLRDAFSKALVLQFGGASGTLAALNMHFGDSMGQRLARDLDLNYPLAPWHTRRERLAGLVCACGVMTGALGKIGRDISLLMQNEVAEVSEPGGQGRGGSSTMPHKRNPIGCAITLASANRLPGLVASFLSCMVQEHERGVGGWQAEWPILSQAIQATGVAAASMAEVAEGLTVDAARMRANIESTRGLIFAEKAMMLLAPKVGRDVAHKIVEEASRRSIAEGRRLAEVLADMPEVTRHLDAATIQRLEVPEEYLGCAEAFRRRLLDAAEHRKLPAEE